MTYHYDKCSRLEKFTIWKLNFINLLRFILKYSKLMLLYDPAHFCYLVLYTHYEIPLLFSKKNGIKIWVFFHFWVFWYNITYIFSAPAGKSELDCIGGRWLVNQVLETLVKDQCNAATIHLAKCEIPICSGLKKRKRNCKLIDYE